MSQQDELTRLLALAQAMENSQEVQERKRMIDRRAQLYHLDWPHKFPKGVLKAIDPAPQYVGQRAEDKLCAQPFTISCRADWEQALVDWAEANTLADADPREHKMKMEELKKQAREAADRKEAGLLGLLYKIEAQQGVDITRMFAHSAAIYAFAGPCRLGYDETAEAEPGVVPLYVQFLDPRALLVKPGTKAGQGPELVIYKRQATHNELRYEGWEVDEPGQKFEPQDVQPDSQMTVYDCWEKVRKKTKGKYELQLWHSIILDGGKGGQRFLKKPMNVAIRGCTTIPYVFVPVRAATFMHENYVGSSSQGFLDVFDTSWELQNLVLTFQAQMVQLAVDPPTLQKTEDTVQIEVGLPGAQNQVRPNEDAKIMENDWARPEIAQMAQMLDQKLQKSTFTSPSYGEGNTQTSGLQTARLQASSEEGLGATRTAVEQALEQLFKLIALFARHYLAEQEFVVPSANGMATRIVGAIFNGEELFEVHLPGLTRYEATQLAMACRSLSDPRPDGSRFISDETAREISQLVHGDHIETHRILREQVREVQYQRQKAMQLEAATRREEGIKDMFAAEQAKMKLLQQRQAMMAEQQKFQNDQQRAMMGRAQEQGQPQPAGVAASPVAESAPNESDRDYGWDPGGA